MLELEKKELISLAGTSNSRKIKNWLVSLGINFLPDIHGFPKVSREIMCKKLNGDVEMMSINNKKGDEEALRKAMRLK